MSDSKLPDLWSLYALMLEAGVAFCYTRVCTRSTIPYARHLEDQALPNVDRICTAVRGM